MTIGLPDESGLWKIRAAKSAFGMSAGCVLVDEAWELTSHEVSAAVIPTISARSHQQVWLFSTANDQATDLVLGRLSQGSQGSSAVMGWWGDAGDDPHDWEALRRAAPFHDGRREVPIRMLWGRPRELATEYLNRWPQLGVDGVGWPPGLAGCSRVEGDPPAGGVGCVESTVDRSRFGAAVAVPDGVGGVDVWCREFDDLVAAVDWLSGCGVLLVGLSLRDWVVTRLEVVGVGSRELLGATAVFEELVRAGRVRHEHGRVLLEQSGAARLAESERGRMLYGRKSLGPVHVLKSVVWAVERAVKPVQSPAAAIY